jgi:hypothetical protein
VNKSVPTLLGIVIILLVALLVVGFYQIRLQRELTAGKTVVGTVGGEVLTGVDMPEEEIGTVEVLGAGPEGEVKPSPATSPDTRAGERRREAEGKRTAREGESETE